MTNTKRTFSPGYVQENIWKDVHIRLDSLPSSSSEVNSLNGVVTKLANKVQTLEQKVQGVDTEAKKILKLLTDFKSRFDAGIHHKRQKKNKGGVERSRAVSRVTPKSDLVEEQRGLTTTEGKTGDLLLKTASSQRSPAQSSAGSARSRERGAVGSELPSDSDKKQRPSGSSSSAKSFRAENEVEMELVEVAGGPRGGAAAAAGGEQGSTTSRPVNVGGMVTGLAAGEDEEVGGTDGGGQAQQPGALTMIPQRGTISSAAVGEGQAPVTCVISVTDTGAGGRRISPTGSRTGSRAASKPSSGFSDVSSAAAG